MRYQPEPDVGSSFAGGGSVAGGELAGAEPDDADGREVGLERRERDVVVERAAAVVGVDEAVVVSRTTVVGGAGS